MISEIRVATVGVHDLERSRHFYERAFDYVELASGRVAGPELCQLWQMPDTMSAERRALLRGYGATIELVPDTKGMHGAVARAEALLAEHPDWYMPRQFENPANPEVHRRTTAVEILRQVPGITAFVAGVGTGGTITGVGEVLHAERAGTLVAAKIAGSRALTP